VKYKAPAGCCWPGALADAASPPSSLAQRWKSRTTAPASAAVAPLQQRGAPDGVLLRHLSLSSRCSFSSVVAGRDPDRSFRIAVVT